MTNRNILDQNGFNSRNILNIRNQKLKDGKAIKINTSITNKNEIDVNMKTNTTEQTTIGDTDLFLLSDTTGETIKYITGINLKQKALLHLVGGTNINLTTDAQGDTEINLDSQIELQKTTIIKNPKSTSFPTGFSTVIQASGAQEGYDEFRIVADGSPNLRKLIGITATTVSANHTLDFNNGIFTNVETINGSHTDTLTLNNDNQNFLIKPSTVNFSADDIFSVDSNFKITNVTRTALLNTLTASNGLVKNTNDIKISSTPLININQTATFKNATGNAEIKLESGNDVGYESRLFWFNNGVERARFVYSSNNNKFDLLTKTGSIHLKSFQDTNDGTSRLLLDNGSFQLQAGSASVSLTDIIKGTLTDVNIYKNTTISQLLTISAHPTINTLGGVLKLSKPSKSGITNNRDFEILTDLQNSDNNRILVFRALSSNYDFLSMGDFSGSNQIRANAKMIIQPSADDYTNDEFMLHIKSFENKDCRVCIESDMVNGGGEDHHPTLLFKQDGSLIKTEIGLNVSNRFYFHHPATNTDHSRIEFFLGSATMDASSLVLQLSPLAVDCNKILNVSTDGINNSGNNLNLKANGTVLISGSTDRITFNKRLCFTSSTNNDRFIVLQGSDINNDSRIIGYDNRIDMIGKEAGGTNPAIRLISGSTTVFQIHQNKSNMYKPLYMNSNHIYLDGSVNHYIVKNGSDMDGIEVAGSGSGGSLEVPVFRIKRTSGDTLFEAKQKCIEMYKPLYMNSTSSSNRPIYLHTDENFFVKYKFANSTGNKINGTDLGGYGGSNGTDFASVRITATDVNYSGTLAEFFPKNIKMYKHAGVILDNNTQFPLSENDAFTIRKDGLCNLLIRSFSNSAKIQLQSSNNFTSSIEYSGSQFRIETVNQEFRTVASHHNFYNGSSLRLAFQSDTNLVVYNGSTVKFASNDGQNAHSSRDYKKNINDLVESESINIIKNINPVSFEYIEKYWDEHDQADSDNCNIRKGFIWEDMKPILPQTTRTINSNNAEEETTKTLDMKMVVPDLTKTVQYLLNKVETLTEQLITQSTLISNLQSQLNNI